MTHEPEVGRFELAVHPRSDDFADDDERWQSQVRTLVGELGDQVDVQQRTAPGAPGSKGGVDALILALGSAGAFTATVECFKAWLARDRSRSIDLRWNVDGAEHSVTFTGDSIDTATVQEVARAAAAQMGGRSWSADTAPS